MTPAQKRKAARAAAKPEVLRLVKKYGRAAISNILSTLREKEKNLKKAADLRKELADLERRI